MARMMITLRQAGESDVDDILAIETSSFSDPWSEAMLYRCVTGTDMKTYVADESGWIIGFAVVSRSGSDAELQNIAVMPAARGRGAAAQLLDYVLRQIKLQRLENVYLEVRESNAAAIALYEKFGFVSISKRKRYYEDPEEDALVMHLNCGGD